MPATLSDDDKAFIRAILNDPAELTRWLVYADWLDERDDPRARFIRLEVRRLDPDLSEAERYWVAGELAHLRPTLDPDWVAVFDRPRIENCVDRLFAFKCPRQWEQLKGTADPLVRHCDACEKPVYYCHDLTKARAHVGRGECVAVAADAARHPGDLLLFRLEESGVGLRGLVVRQHGPVPPPAPAPAPRRPWWKFW